MTVETSVSVLGFTGVVEEAVREGSTSVRIDDATAPGRVDEAHAALQPYLATGARVDVDGGAGGPVRVAAMIYDVDGQVVRLRLEPTDDAPARDAFEL